MSVLCSVNWGSIRVPYFSRVVKVKTQVVSGTMHHLTIEAVDASKEESLLEAKVWEKPWENFRSLHEINHLGDSTSA